MEAVQSQNPDDFWFSLEAVSKQIQKKLSVDCDFSPTYCRRSSKAKSIIPTFSPNKDPFSDAFQVESGSEIRSRKGSQIYSMRDIGDTKKHLIYQPKPSSMYCQICKEFFQDYSKVLQLIIKHCQHPLHIQKLQQKDMEFDFQSLKDILKSKVQKNKRPRNKIVLEAENDEKVDENDVKSYTSIQKDEEQETQQPEVENFCSKKRIVINRHESSQETISLKNDSTQLIEDTVNDLEGKPQVEEFKRKPKKKYSIFRNIVKVVHHKEEEP